MVPSNPQASWAPKPWKNSWFFLVLWPILKESLHFLRFCWYVCSKIMKNLSEYKDAAPSLFNNSENPYRFLILLKCEFQNCWYFVRRMQKMLRHMDGILENHAYSLGFLIFLNCDFQKYWYFGWRMRKVLRHMDGVIHFCCISLGFLILLKCNVPETL